MKIEDVEFPGDMDEFEEFVKQEGWYSLPCPNGCSDPTVAIDIFDQALRGTGFEVLVPEHDPHPMQFCMFKVVWSGV